LNKIEQTGEFVVCGTAAGLVEQIIDTGKHFLPGRSEIIHGDMPDGPAVGSELWAAPECSAATIVMLSGARGDEIEARAGEARADLCLTAGFRRLDLVRPVDLIERLA
jgi:hypothetical protein